MADAIRAAGGVVVRDGRVLIVHRPRHGDWTLPKGKLDPGETWEQAALREVEEETGLRCALGDYLGATHYEVDGEPKEVRWWAMTADGEARPANEVDAVRWVPLPAAPAELSYERDRELLQRL
jgi:8-oxo-dGTP diphosphatase